MLPQERGTEAAISKLRDMVALGKVEVRAYLRSPLHAKAYLCWYDNHAEPGAAVVGSSNLTLAGFTGNTELNVRVTGDAEMAAESAIPVGQTAVTSTVGNQHKWDRLGPEKIIIIMKSCVGAP